MSERCHNHPLDAADDICDSCYGPFCSTCLVALRTKPHPICKDCALILSGVRGTRKPKKVGDKKTVKQRRKELKKVIKEPKFFRFFDDEDDKNPPPESTTENTHKEVQSLGKVHDALPSSPLEKLRNLTPFPSDIKEETEEVKPFRSVDMAESQDKVDADFAGQVEEIAVHDAFRMPESETAEAADGFNMSDAAEAQPEELDAIEEFDLGLETTSVRQKKNERMTFATQIKELPEPESTGMTIEQLAAAKQQPAIAKPDLAIPKSPKEFIGLGAFDKSVIDIANASYRSPAKKLSSQKISSETRAPAKEKTAIRQQLDAMLEPPSHRRLHQKDNTAEVPAVLTNVHPSELQREETFEVRTMRPEEEKVEASVGSPAQETDHRGVYIPPALRGKEYNDSPLPKRRGEDGD